MPLLNYSESFSKNIQDIYGQKGKEWLEALPTLIEKICHVHSLDFINAMPNLSYNFVALVTGLNTKERAVLKMAPTSEFIAKEAQWYQCISHQVPKLFWYDEIITLFS